MLTLRRLSSLLVTALLAALSLLIVPTSATAQIYSSGIFSVSYNGDLYQVDKSSGSIHRLSYSEWLALGSPAATPRQTDFVKYPWSPTIYAVTFFGSERHEWVWASVSYSEWQHAGSPAPHSAGWIQGSYYYQWATSDEIFVLSPDGVKHKLTGQQWADAGRPAPERFGNDGFYKYSWDPTILHMTDLAGGHGYAISGSEWRHEDYPTPQVVNRVVGDQVYTQCGSSDIWYAGPGLNRRISYAEWSAMGRPAPTLQGGPCAPAPAPAPSVPPKPADLDCPQFRTKADAQREFDRLFPYYGDYHGLDADGDREACESYFG